MTFIKCCSCNRATFFHSENCKHCGKSIKEVNDRKYLDIDEIIRPLYGVGGTSLPRYLCPKCHFVNEVDAKVCEDCGQDL